MHLHRQHHVQLPRTLRRAAAIVVISESVKRELVGAFDLAPDRIAVIHPAADPAVFRPDLPPDAGRDVRAKYGLDGPYLFSLSTLEPRKNFAGLVEGYAMLPEEVRSRMPLVVAGGQAPLKKMKELFMRLRPDAGALRFCGKPTVGRSGETDRRGL